MVLYLLLYHLQQNDLHVSRMDEHLLHRPVYEYAESPVLGGRLCPRLDRDTVVISGDVFWVDMSLWSASSGGHRNIYNTALSCKATTCFASFLIFSDAETNP